MKVLFIGGTGTISGAITNLLASQGTDLYLLNRGNRMEGVPDGVKTIIADIKEEETVKDLIKDMYFDVVVDFIAFVPAQLERDYRLFAGKCKQFIFISSASAYQKPLSNYIITESTPLANPYWEYSRNKIACEEYLIKKYRENGFPVTIVRPSHTYDKRSVPLGIHGSNGSWQVIKRMISGKPVIIHGDGTSLWTMTNSKDFAKGFVGIMGNIHAIGETFHITSDESLTWNQIYKTIADTLSVPLNAVHIASDTLAAKNEYDLIGSLFGDKANSVVFDNSKIKSFVPDFIATIRFDQGIRETIEYIMQHNELQKEDDAFDLWCDEMIDKYVSKV